MEFSLSLISSIGSLEMIVRAIHLVRDEYRNNFKNIFFISIHLELQRTTFSTPTILKTQILSRDRHPKGRISQHASPTSHMISQYASPTSHILSRDYPVRFQPLIISMVSDQLWYLFAIEQGKAIHFMEIISSLLLSNKDYPVTMKVDVLGMKSDNINVCEEKGFQFSVFQLNSEIQDIILDIVFLTSDGIGNGTTF